VGIARATKGDVTPAGEKFAKSCGRFPVERASQNLSERYRPILAMRPAARSQRPDNGNLQEDHRSHAERWNEKSEAQIA
jgi:hypothetical protein